MTGTDIDLRIPGPGSPAVLRAKDRIALELALTSDPNEVLDAIVGTDPAKRQKWRMRMRRWALEDDFQKMYMNYMKAEQLLWSGAILRALHRRASRGNIPAIKLAMEASGLHNPRVQHEHSGEIVISLKGLPRPVPTPDDDQVVDADVVEDNMGKAR